jgi:Hint domain-containing protein
MSATQVNLQLADEVAKYYADPLKFVMFAYPWGEKGPLQNETGPDDNQKEFLRSLGAEVKRRRFDGHTPVMPTLMAETSGHGTGKSAMGAWIANWIMSTRPGSIGTVTAGTYQQLESRTWAAIQHWTRLCITSHWFEMRAGGVYNKARPADWKVVIQSCKEENAQAFAGQHAATSTSWYLFDEASEVPDAVWKVAYGGLTDGEPMMFAWGQPVRNTGEFYRVCFGSLAERWNHRRVDSRTSRFTNKSLIEQWIADYGLDSDFVRVRVLGMPPTASELQFIDWERIRGAMSRRAEGLPDEPLIAGFDVSGGGAAWNVIRFRRGYDARSLAPIRITGERGRDRGVLIAAAAEVLSDQRPGRKVAAMFVDSAFGAAIVERLHTLGHRNVHEVSFGGKSNDEHQENMRAYMWHRMKEWLLNGAIPEDEDLASQLTRPGYHINRSNRLVLESKADMQRRGEASPDDADALCFVAGTLIKTQNGMAPIEQITPGDLVVTPFGASPVAATWVSGATSLTTAMFSNGESLTGKGSHEVFTFSAGRKRIDALSLTDEVEIYSRWRLFLWQLVSSCFIGARNFGFKRAALTFSPGARIQRSDFCIVGFGATCMALSQTVSRFITQILTGATMILGTLNFGLRVPTSANTCGNASASLSMLNGTASISTGPGWLLPNGMVRLLESLGTRSMGRRRGLGESQENPSVPDAANAIQHSLRGDPNIVPLHASRPFCSGRTSRMLACVHTAGINLWRIAIGRRPVVPVSVRTASAPPTPTYNLTLVEHNAYYANGILVFNCLTFAQHVGPVRPEPKEPEVLEFHEGFRDGGWLA